MEKDRFSPTSHCSDDFELVDDFHPDRFTLSKTPSPEHAKAQLQTATAQSPSLIQTSPTSVTPVTYPANDQNLVMIDSRSDPLTNINEPIHTQNIEMGHSQLMNPNDDKSRQLEVAFDLQNSRHRKSSDGASQKRSRAGSRSGRNSIFGITFLPLPEEQEEINNKEKIPVHNSSTVYRAKSRLMPQPLTSANSSDEENAHSSPSSPVSPSRSRHADIRRSVLLSHLAPAPIVGTKQYHPRHFPANDNHDEDEDDSNDPSKPLSPTSSSIPISAKEKRKRKKHSKSKKIQSARTSSAVATEQPPQPSSSHRTANTRPKKRLQDLEEGNDEDDSEEYLDKDQRVNHDLNRIFKRQRQRLPCNIHYDFNLLLLALMSIFIFLLKPLFALLGYLWRSWQRMFLPDHTSTFDYLVASSVIVLYCIWLPLLMIMTGVAAVVSMCGLVYLFRRCCVPVVEELEIDRNIQQLQRRLTIIASAPPHLNLQGSSAGQSVGFLSSYTMRSPVSNANNNEHTSWLPAEEMLISPYELLVLPLLIAGEGILTIQL